MLGKLIKHEFKATYKALLMIYVAVIGLSIVNAMSMNVYDGENMFIGFVQVLLMIAYVVGALAAEFVTIIYLIRRFYNHMFKDEGYLAHTLPVKPWQHLVAKFIVDYVWVVLSTVVVMFSIFILFACTGNFLDILTGIREITKIVFDNGNILLMILDMLLSVLVSSAAQIMIIFAAICAGQFFAGHRVIGAFAFYMLFTFINQTISGMFTLAFNLETTKKYNAYFDGANHIYEIPAAFHAVMLTAAVLSAVMGVVYFFVAKYALTKRLNIE